MHIHTRRAKRISKRARKTDYPPRVAKHLSSKSRQEDPRMASKMTRRGVSGKKTQIPRVSTQSQPGGVEWMGVRLAVDTKPREQRKGWRRTAESERERERQREREREREREGEGGKHREHLRPG